MAKTPEQKVREESLIFLFSSRHKQLYMSYIQYTNKHKAMTKTATLSIRVDMDTKEKAETICSSLGMPLSGAVNVFLHSLVRNNGFPFDLRLETPNPETISAMQEARLLAKDAKAKSYADADALFADIL